jgi:hypothetical protein
MEPERHMYWYRDRRSSMMDGMTVQYMAIVRWGAYTRCHSGVVDSADGKKSPVLIVTMDDIDQMTDMRSVTVVSIKDDNNV